MFVRVQLPQGVPVPLEALNGAKIDIFGIDVVVFATFNIQGKDVVNEPSAVSVSGIMKRIIEERNYGLLIEHFFVFSEHELKYIFSELIQR